jgi:ribosomal-protein-alanine N-acetyltransferase
MLARLLDWADGGAVYLEVRTDNEPAIAMYEKAGFANIGLRKRYYRVSGADAYTMRREPT